LGEGTARHTGCGAPGSARLPHDPSAPGCRVQAVLFCSTARRAASCTHQDDLRKSLAPRRKPRAGRDFLLERRAPDGIECIVTNPPYRLADQFVEHALTFDKIGCRWTILGDATEVHRSKERGQLSLDQGQRPSHRLRSDHHGDHGREQ
jgi:hypothetical protein